MANFEAHGSTVATRLKLAFKRVYQIADFFFIDVKIAVSRYAELVATIDLESGKQIVDMFSNDRGKEDKVVATGRAQMIRQSNDARQRSRCLHHAAVTPATKRIFAVQADKGASGQVGWVVGIKRAAAELYPLLRQPGTVWNSAEALLVRQVDAGIEYLSPTKAADDNPGRIFAADTPRLAAAFALGKPGGFAIRRDYQGRDVLLSARKIRAAPWTLFYKIDRAEALGPSDDRARRLLIWMLGAIVAVIAVYLNAKPNAVHAQESVISYNARYIFIGTESQPAIFDTSSGIYRVWSPGKTNMVATYDMKEHKIVVVDSFYKR